MVNYLFGCAHRFGNFAVGPPFPHQTGLAFLYWSGDQQVARVLSSFKYIAVANFTRLRPLATPTKGQIHLIRFPLASHYQWQHRRHLIWDVTFQNGQTIHSSELAHAD
jgi:hypothetical protein